MDGIEQAHCQLEWTGIRLGAAHYWTLGFEAFPQEPGLKASGREQLVQVVTKLLAGVSAAPALTAGRSASYPEWLSKYGTGEAD